MNLCKNCNEEIRPLFGAPEIPTHVMTESRICRNNKTLAEYIDENPVLTGKISININEEIEFELTNAGRKHYIKHYNKCPNSNYIKMQLWEFINLFGSEFFNGMFSPLIENNDIIINLKRCKLKK
jgi:hypothetical protein